MVSDKKLVSDTFISLVTTTKHPCFYLALYLLIICEVVIYLSK